MRDCRSFTSAVWLVPTAWAGWTPRVEVVIPLESVPTIAAGSIKAGRVGVACAKVDVAVAATLVPTFGATWTACSAERVTEVVGVGFVITSVSAFPLSIPVIVDEVASSGDVLVAGSAVVVVSEVIATFPPDFIKSTKS